MNWTYNEYVDQPDWFIETLILKWSIENEVENNKSKRNGKQ